MTMVDPLVVSNFVQQQKKMAAAAPDNAAEADSIVAGLEATKHALRTQLTATNVVFLPIHAEGQWALLTVKKDAAGVRHLEWRDSLDQESQHCRATASQILEACFVPAAKESCTLPPRCNSAMQAVGSNTSGGFVLFWMEQAFRVHCRGESPCSMKWPCSGHWGHKLQKILITLKALQTIVNEQKSNHNPVADQNTKVKSEKAAKLGQGNAKTEEFGAEAVPMLLRRRCVQNEVRAEGAAFRRRCVKKFVQKAARAKLKQRVPAKAGRGDKQNREQTEAAMLRCIADVNENCTSPPEPPMPSPAGAPSPSEASSSGSSHRA